jgi:hypothetical protein
MALYHNFLSYRANTFVGKVPGKGGHRTLAAPPRFSRCLGAATDQTDCGLTAVPTSGLTGVSSYGWG